MNWEIRQGDALERLRAMPDQSVQTCITSPPYWGLRDYGDVGQLGLESTPDEYVAKLVAVFREVRRVLRDDGTLWLNLGDSYAGSWGAQPRPEPGAQGASTLGGGSMLSARQIEAHPRGTQTGSLKNTPGLKPKDLVGIPWRVAFALQADGWWLRSDIIWAKPNPMPESVTDRPTRSHEYLFLLTKSARYFYDAEAIREDDLGTDHPRNILDRPEPSGGLLPAHNGIRREDGRNGTGRNKRSVWTLATRPYPEAHFATFPPKLIEPCVLAGSAEQACGVCGAPWERVVERTAMEVREGPGRAAAREAAGGASGSRTAVTGTMTKAPTSGTVGWCPSCAHDDGNGSSVVLDPFAGAGTTGVVALRRDRSFIGLELNPDYCELARRRIRDDAPLFNVVSEVAA